MSQSYVIEVDDISAGLVVRDAIDRRYTFFASDNPFWPLEGRAFGSVREAEQAARALIKRPGLAA